MTGTPCDVPEPRNVNEKAMLNFLFAECCDNRSNVRGEI